MSLRCKVETLKVCWDGGCLYLIFNSVGNAETKTKVGERVWGFKYLEHNVYKSFYKISQLYYYS